MNINFRLICFSSFWITIAACETRCNYCNLRDFDYVSMACKNAYSIKGIERIGMEPLIGYRWGRLVLVFDLDRDEFYETSSYMSKDSKFKYIQFREIEPDVYFANYECIDFFVERKKGIWALHEMGITYCSFYKIKDGNLYCASHDGTLTASLLDKLKILKDVITYSSCIFGPDSDTLVVRGGCYR